MVSRAVVPSYVLHLIAPGSLRLGCSETTCSSLHRTMIVQNIDSKMTSIDFYLWKQAASVGRRKQRKFQIKYSIKIYDYDNPMPTPILLMLPCIKLLSVAVHSDIEY